MLKNFFYLTVILILLYGGINAQDIKGKVFIDQNHNLKFDAEETGLKDILVSNGRNVVKTDSKGDWNLPEQDLCFRYPAFRLCGSRK